MRFGTACMDASRSSIQQLTRANEENAQRDELWSCPPFNVLPVSVWDSELNPGGSSDGGSCLEPQLLSARQQASQALL